MATIFYTIVQGNAPFTAELTPSLIPVNNHVTGGTYQFDNVPNGNYNLIITDANGCIIETQLNVDPFVTTTTTTQLPIDSIIIGQAQDETLIFDVNGTNREDHYSGYPDENTSTLYLWLKLFENKPTNLPRVINYSITTTGSSTFQFNGLSDEIHAQVMEITQGPASTINGQLFIKNDFIETYFQYTYVKDTLSPDFQINLDSQDDWLYANIPLTGGTNQYGITYIDRNNAIMNF